MGEVDNGSSSIAVLSEPITTNAYKDLSVFNNPKFGDVRIIIDESENFWFVGKDVAEALGYSNTNDALTRHCKGVVKCYPIKDAMNRIRDTRIISEPDLYRLIINSKLESAQEFERWLMEEVLPSIRKTGSYGRIDAKKELQSLLKSSDGAIMLLTALTEEQDKVKARDERIAVLEPKAERYEDLTNCEGLFTATELAKDYGMTAIAFNKLLHQQGIQYKAGNIWVPYRAYQNEGFLRTVNYKPDNSDRTVQQSRWTMKGKEFVYELFRSLDIHPLYKSNEQLTIN